MSEFSDSFHVRSPKARALAQKMADCKLRGVVYPSKNGWCSVVPFEGDERTAEELANCFGAAVLHYIYAEDHGWGFALVESGRISTRYEAFWDDDIRVDNTELRMEVLRPFSLANVDFDALEKALRDPRMPEPGDVPLAYRFAKALGLPRFEWLSARYVTADFKRGELPKSVSVVGAPDPDPMLPQPSFDKVAVPRSDLSAFEALELLTPYVAQWDADVHSDGISSSGDLSKRDAEGPMVSSQGRLTQHGEWSARFISKRHGVLCSVALRASGHVSIKPFGIGVNTRIWQRPGECIDSPRLLQITEPIYEAKRPSDGPPLYDRILQLGTWGADERCVWTLMYFCHAKGMGRWDLDLVVDAVTGEVIRSAERSLKP